MTYHPLIGVMLLSFGTAATVDDIPAYLASVRGRPAPPEMIDEFQRRWRLIGGSPLTRITLEQAAALERLLDRGQTAGPRFRVAVGMRHARPFIADAMAELAGAARVVAVILAPQQSPVVMAGYHQALEEARSRLAPGIRIQSAGAWHREPAFLEALALRVREGLDRLSPEERRGVPVLFTAHSLPRVVAERDPGYIAMLRETAQSTADRLGLSPGRWQFAYQSAGKTTQEWLTPDIKDLFPSLREQGCRKVLVAPIQFLADHMEVLYDIDVEARAAARQAGIDLVRTEALNTMPRFIDALAGVVRRELENPGS